ncbi:carboxypeptidase regulatory-like domain-containing protein [Pontibacter sp. KCTC 32443]|uniref:carboxypeptidase-like regulatory domain-containing protein n=1 Tax=Pontibacter TaxID=323449 RepID=UPI00164D6C5E|nr:MULTISPECIES: carboxypeptidase-like regulatory domain-containing protein [Pontibacter]MBC5773166.1 carboxypeptidase regulatory-like domain-containing protein [Pontibacter sp. KCTC 32443]
MLKLNKLYLLAFSTLLTACEPDDTATEISGKVIDIETNAPVVDAKLNLTVGEGFALGGGFSNPVKHTTTSGAAGNYTFIIPENKDQKVYLVIPEKANYVDAREPNNVGAVLKSGERNQQDIYVAQGSYLSLNISKTPSDKEKTLKLSLSYTSSSDASPIFGVPSNRDLITINTLASDSTITRGYYFKQTSKINLDWEIITTGVDGKTETFSETIDLKEHATVNFEINY